MRKIILCLGLITLINSIEAQIILDTQLNGSQTYDIFAPQNIRMFPGFDYLPQGNNYFWAHIDSNLPMILPINYVEDPIDPESREIETNFVVGTTLGQASVSLSGGAIYSIPIFSAPGTAGMQPSISLEYNSQAGNGIAGYGWNIAGISSITRTPHTIYHDGLVKGVDFGDDRYSLDGQRLINLGGSTYGSDGAVYYSEKFNGCKIISHGSTGQGPEWFEVFTKDGKIIEYGHNEMSRLTSQLSNQSTIRWFINRITDANGNYIDFSYIKQPLEVLLNKIEYSGNNMINPPIEPYNSIEFFYRYRTDKLTHFIGGTNDYAGNGSRIEQSVVIDHIEVKSESEIIKTYVFKYYFSFYSKLNELVEYGKDNSRFNSTVFSYDEEDHPDIIENTHIGLGYLPTVICIDFNNDGLADIFKADGQDYKWSIFLNQGDGEFNENDPDYVGNLLDNRIYSFSTCDINSDGYTDMLFSSKTNDWNGDPRYNLELFLYNGNGFDQFNVFDENDLLSGYDDLSVSVSPLDINGDTKDEIILQVRLTNSVGTIDRLEVFNIEVNNGILNKQLLTYITTGMSSSVERLIPADFDGDGKDEVLLTFSNNFSQMYKFKYFNNQYHDSRIYAQNFLPLDSKPFLGDYNGDGRLDLLVRSEQGIWSIAYWLGDDFLFEELPVIIPVIQRHHSGANGAT